jgi:hypothetical protein
LERGGGAKTISAVETLVRHRFDPLNEKRKKEANKERLVYDPHQTPSSSSAESEKAKSLYALPDN